MSDDNTGKFISGIMTDSRWFTPASQQQFIDSKFGPFSLFTDTKKLFSTSLNVMWPPFSAGLIITMLISVIGLGAVVGCWIGDIAFPATNRLTFTMETLAMAFGSAALVFVFRYTRSGSTKRPPWSETIKEFCALAIKFGIVHLFFQFTGFYSWVFKDSAMGGILTKDWEGRGIDIIEREKEKCQRENMPHTSERSIYDTNVNDSHQSLK